MRKNSYDFTVPNRQSVFAIIMILWKTIRVITAQIFPVLLVLLFGNSKNKPAFLVIAVIIVAVLAMVISIVKYFKTWFYISGQDIIVHKGIIKKTKITIPFEKIQSVHFEQNVLQQLFDVTQLNIETAGSEKTEFLFHAIENEKAHALRDYIFASRQQNPEDNENPAKVQGVNNVTTFRKIMSLEISDLLKVGITENHIKSFLVIIVFFYWIFQNIREAGMDLEAYSEEVAAWSWSFQIMLTIIILLVITSIIISLARVVFSNFDLRFLRVGNGFKIIRGLLSKKELSVSDHKIQIISWSDNLLKAAVGFNDLYLSQASGTYQSSKQRIKIPGCNQKHIRDVVTEVLGNIHPENIKMHYISQKYFTRFTAILLLVMAIVSGIFFYIKDLTAVIFIVVLVMYFILVRYLAYKKRKYGYNDTVLYIRGGKWGNRSDLLQIYKIQGIQIRQTPFQSRNQLCNLVLFTASGKISIPYIPIEHTKKMVDDFMYKLETTRKRWM